MKANFDLYPNFSKAEFDCKHTGKNEMKHSFMSKLQALRTAYGKPMIISSGLRVSELIKQVAADFCILILCKITPNNHAQLYGATKTSYHRARNNSRGNSSFIILRIYSKD